MTLAKTAAALALATVLWLPNTHRFYDVNPTDRAAIATSLSAAAQNDATVGTMRAMNPEWDFMARTFTVLGFANRALRNPAERVSLLASIDRVVDETLRAEETETQYHFMLAYGRARPFVDPEGRSVFVDGELLVMMAARDLVEPRPELHAEMRMRAERIERTMRRGPMLSAESYPNECWTFCNTTALAGLVMTDRALGTDHRDLSRKWVAFAREHLVEQGTGILVSSYTYDGHVRDGAEGSSIWMSAHNLLVVDEVFAKEQYGLARRELGRTVLGFGYALEWPERDVGRPDIDSGPIVPFLGASAGSSGLALLGASAFHDDAWLGPLLASLELAAVPIDDAAGRHYAASNKVGDAVIFYSLEAGPLWDRIRRPS